MRRQYRWIIILIILVVLMPVLLELAAPYSPWKRFEPFQTPSQKHWLGTNDMGQDIFSELLAGSTITLLTGLTAAVLSSAIGLLLGLFSGYFKGKTDNLIMGLTDIFLTIPKIPLLIVLTAYLNPAYWMIGIILGFLWWPSTLVVVRSKTRQMRETGYVESSRCLGFKSRHIIFSEIFPNIREVVLSKFLINLATAMSAEASVSFLGLGNPESKSWGMMLNFAFIKGGFANGMWWWYLPPGICILLVVFTVMWLGFRLGEKKKDAIRFGGDLS